MNSLASVLRDLGKNEQAIKLHAMALKIKELAVGEDHPDSILYNFVYFLSDFIFNLNEIIVI